MISISNLSFSYKHHQVFNGLNIDLNEGNIYGLLGQNGVGKTTLLKLLAGLLKSDQSCRINGYIPCERKTEFLSQIYYLPEDLSFPDLKIKDYLKHTAPFYPRFSKELFDQTIQSFDVDPSQKFSQLSQGQRKKAMISCAVSFRTPLLLMDEPSNGLDIPSKAQFRSVVARLCDNDTITIISTHQVRDLENLIDPIIILDNSGILLHETISRISEKLSFTQDTCLNPDCLYSEQVIGGYQMVEPNTSGIEGPVNVEGLFNACLLNKTRIKNIFK